MLIRLICLFVVRVLGWLALLARSDAGPVAWGELLRGAVGGHAAP